MQALRELLFRIDPDVTANFSDGIAMIVLGEKGGLGKQFTWPGEMN